MTKVDVGGRRLDLSNLDKPLYPDGFTKAEVIDYYTRISPVLLPHLADREVTRVRFPHGAVEAGPGGGFFEKNAPGGTPPWVRTTKKGMIVAEDLATIVWLANLAALELHTPQSKVGAEPDRIVFDLDPGVPAGLDECRAVAQALRERLAADGLVAYAKTSGRKGMQVSCSVTADADRINEYAKSVAAEFAAAAPKLVTDNMAKPARRGKVFIDWSQNATFKTTVCVYSLRAGLTPTVSAPLTWEEVADGDFEAADFTPDAVLDRMAEHGDLHEGLLEAGPAL
ncbi:non-homologous end-joining DNA ligase [Hamadaea tsunoensis]|uniref:non-homologous end-joining DNA ligase n=1 Tax=Hamadaea tsunoensis TaxID=53368 RepID=UPI000424F322|nr:non-homologous end-joining DNA ligase [Hamadaea tsunoensis]